MAFPASPSNNDVHKEGNRAFVYDSALGVWDQVRETDRTENKISGTIHPTTLGSGTIGSGVTFPTGHIIQTIFGPVSQTNYNGTDMTTITATNTTASITKIYGNSSKILIIGQYSHNIYQGNVTNAAEMNLWVRRTTQQPANFGDNRHYGPKDEGGDTYHNLYGMSPITTEDPSSANGVHTYVIQLAPGSPNSGTPSGGLNDVGQSLLILFEVMK